MRRRTRGYVQVAALPIDSNNERRRTSCCHHCQARFFMDDRTTRGTYSKCRRNGQVALPRPQQEFSCELWEVFTGQHVLFREFKENIIVYNNCFQFASVQANLRDLPGRCPYVYTIQGQIYHHYTGVNVNRNHCKCGLLYFLDPEKATRQRLEDAAAFNVHPDFMRMLSQIILCTTPIPLLGNTGTCTVSTINREWRWLSS